MEQLREHAEAIQRARSWLDGFRDRKKAAEAGYREAHKDLFDALSEAEEQLRIAETAGRQAALNVYHETGVKVLSYGFNIQERTQLEYDDTRALEWAKEHGMALKLDKPAFEKLAKASLHSTPEMRGDAKAFGIVDAHVMPSATIAQDLTKVLTESRQTQEAC